MSENVDLNQVYYQKYFQFPGRSVWMEKIWSEAFVENYPEGMEHYGYLTKQDLEAIASLLQLPRGSKVLDIGCGKGGPGLRLAEQLGWELTGIDIIPEAVEQARGFQQQFHLDHPARFEVGEFYHIPFEDQTFDAVISIDALWAATNKITAFEEAKRVMKPGARFVFTHWDLIAEEPIPLLEQSGLTFISRQETAHWKDYQMRVYEGIVEYQKELIAEMGESASMLIHEVMTTPQILDASVRRIYAFGLGDGEKTVPELQTERLEIRKMAAGDLANFHAYRSDEEVTRYQGFDVMDLGECKAFIAEQEDKVFGKPGEWVQYGIALRASGELIGDCALRVHAQDPRIGEIGITLSREVQGNGYAQEAMRGLLAFFFETWGLHRVEETVDAENAAAAKLLESLGFRLEAHFIENIFFKGKWGSEFQYAMLRREWEAGK